MSLYFLFVEQEFSLLPAVLFGWDDEDDAFYVEAGWLNLFLGVSFG